MCEGVRGTVAVHALEGRSGASVGGPLLQLQGARLTGGGVSLDHLVGDGEQAG
jgi:hypothetical protein